MESFDELFQVGYKLYNKALIRGATQVEVYISIGESTEINYDNGIVETTNAQNFEISLRIALNRKVGYAATNIRSKDPEIFDNIIDNLVKTAINNARKNKEDPKFKCFAFPRSGVGLSIFDYNVADPDFDELAEFLRDKINNIEERDKRIRSQNLSIEMNWFRNIIVNTNGIEVSDEGTSVSFLINLSAKEEDYEAEGFEFAFSRRLSDLYKLAEDIEYTAMRKALDALYGEPLREKITGDLLVENFILIDFLWPIFQHFSALEVINNRSVFANKIKEKIASDKLTIFDDGTNPQGLSASKYDLEGIPKSRNLLVDRGILRSFIYDTYTAYYTDKDSTGNAHRFGGEIYPDFWDIIIKGSKGDLDYLISLVDKGVLVRDKPMGTHNIDPVSGDFSLTFENAYLIINGDIQSAIKPITVSGNSFSLLNKILEIGVDYKIMSWGIAPSVLFENLLFI